MSGWTAALWILLGQSAGETAPAPPPVSAPASPQPIQPPAPGSEATSEPLPGAPRPYSEVGPTTASPRRSAIDTPTLPDRGMGGDAWSDRVRQRMQAAQDRQGSLDGGWMLLGGDGRPLYALQLVDAPGGELEGVWREQPQAGVLAVSGLFSTASRQGAQTVLDFDAPRGGGAAELLLTPGPTGWTGTLSVGGVSRPVRLVRSAAP